jgi:ribonuclease PH
MTCDEAPSLHSKDKKQAWLNKKRNFEPRNISFRVKQKEEEKKDN